MRALTIWQPWATLIARGWKTIETRTHWRYRSLEGHVVAIHAGQHYDEEGEEVAKAYLMEHHGFWLHELEDIFAAARAECGHVVAVARVSLVRTLTADDSAAALCPAKGLVGHFLQNVRRVDPPVKAKGCQGVWGLRPDVERMVVNGLREG